MILLPSPTTPHSPASPAMSGTAVVWKLMVRPVLAVLSLALILAIAPTLLGIGPAWAADAAAASALAASDITALMDSTKAAEWMKLIFGAAAGGEGATLIGEMFRYFNTAVLAVASILMTYNLFAGVAESTYHGEFLGKNYSTVWVPVRLPIAAAMMFPTTNGLSAIQLLMIKLALLGSATADWMFVKTADAIYVDAVPAVAGKYKAPKGIGEGVFMNHFCKHIININEMLMQKDGPVTHKISTSAASTAEAATASGAPTVVKLDWVSPKNPRYHVSCGGASITIPAIDPKVASGVNLAGTYQAALTAMSDTLNTAALAYARNVYPADLDGVIEAKEQIDPGPVIIKANQDFADAVNKALLDVENKMRQDEAAKKGGAAKAALIKEKGWTYAGAAYLDMVAFQASISSQISVTPVVRPATFMNVSQNPQMKKLVAETRQSVSDEISRLTGVPNKKAAERTPGGKHSADEVAEASRDEGFLASKTRESLESVFAIDLDFAEASASKDPLAKVVQFGNELITVAWWWFFSGAIASVVAGIFTFASFAVIIAPPLFMGFSALLGIGVTCGLILPMMPYLTFLMGVVGWLILCVEAVIAGPLWAFGHLKMDGQGLTGGVGNTGYMIVLNIILRPSLMLIGLIASMSLLKVFVMIADETYVTAVMNLKAYAGLGTFEFTAKIFFAVIYGGLIYYMCTKAFQLITQVPDRVLRWIGGGDSLNEAEGVHKIGAMGAAAAGGATGGMMGQMGGQMSSAGRSLGMMGQRRDAQGNVTGIGDRAIAGIRGQFGIGGGTASNGGGEGSDPAPGPSMTASMNDAMSNLQNMARQGRRQEPPSVEGQSSGGDS